MSSFKRMRFSLEAAAEAAECDSVISRENSIQASTSQSDLTDQDDNSEISCASEIEQVEMLLILISTLESNDNHDDNIQEMLWYKYLEVVKLKLMYDPEKMIRLYKNWCSKFKRNDDDRDYDFLLELFVFYRNTKKSS
jgi:hypothetical protein